jgi:hypothetical protein
MLMLGLVACGSVPKGEPPSQPTERIIEPVPSVTSQPEIEARKIVEFRNRSEYENAYQQLKAWSNDDRNRSLIFVRDVPTIVALEVCAWRPDADLFMKIARQSPSGLRSKAAYQLAGERNFSVLHRYQRCFFKMGAQNLYGCENEVSALLKVTPEYADIWRQSPR